MTQAMTPAQVTRFWSLVTKTTDEACWPWRGALDSHGYGRFYYHGRTRPAHRLAWILFYQREIPDGLTLDHLCRHPICSNPRHLEPVTLKENTRRGIGPTALNWRKTHCSHGHPLTEARIHDRPDGPRRRCVACIELFEARRGPRKHGVDKRIRHDRADTRRRHDLGKQA